MKLYLKNVFVALTFIAAASIVSFGQQIVPVNQVAPTLQERCAFDQVHQELINSDPTYIQKNQDFENFVQNFNFSTNKVTPSMYTVPVVVHVMETGNSLTAITDAQIQGAIQQLNELINLIRQKCS